MRPWIPVTAAAGCFIIGCLLIVFVPNAGIGPGFLVGLSVGYLLTWNPRPERKRR